MLDQPSSQSTTPKTPTTTSRNFPNWIDAYLQHIEPISEAPLTFHFWTAVATIGGALRRSVWIDQISWKWFPNHYIILIAPPGIISKTTSIGVGEKMLRKIDGVHWGPQSLTWQKLVTTMAEATDEVTFTTEDGKPAMSIFCSMSSYIGELGTFMKMDDTGLMEVLIPFWDSVEGQWSHSTIVGGEIICESPCFNLIGGTTPDWVKRNFPEGMVGGGLASRLILVFADAKTKLIPYASEIVKPTEYRLREKLLIEDLKIISKMRGPFHLTKEAVELGKKWYCEFWDPIRRSKMSITTRLETYYARKQTHIHKLAMILAAAESNLLVIKAEHLEKALAIIESIEPQIQRVLETVGSTKEANNAERILTLVRTHGFLLQPELWRAVRLNMTSSDFQETLRMLVQSRMLKTETRGTETGVVLGPQA